MRQSLKHTFTTCPEFFLVPLGIKDSIWITFVPYLEKWNKYYIKMLFKNVFHLNSGLLVGFKTHQLSFSYQFWLSLVLYFNTHKTFFVKISICIFQINGHLQHCIWILIGVLYWIYVREVNFEFKMSIKFIFYNSNRFVSQSLLYCIIYHMCHIEAYKN